MADVAILETRERVLAGILLTGAAYLLFSTQDASIKLLVAGMSVWQILFFRSITILTACAAIGGRHLYAETARSPIVWPMLLRSVFTLAAWLCYYNAARSLQLAELTIVYYAAPIIVTVLSVVMLGEKVPMLRWLAVAIGSPASLSPVTLPISGCPCRCCWCWPPLSCGASPSCCCARQHLPSAR